MRWLNYFVPYSVHQPQHDQQNRVEGQHLLRLQTAEDQPAFGPRIGQNLIDHDLRPAAESVAGPRLDRQTVWRRINQARAGAECHQNAVGGVQDIRLNDDGRARLGMVTRRGDGDEVTALNGSG